MPNPEPPKKPDPVEMLNRSTDVMSRLPELMAKGAESEWRLKVVNMKLTLLLEHFEVAWKDEPRILKIDEDFRKAQKT